MIKYLFFIIIILNINCSICKNYCGGLTKEGTEIIYDAYMVKQNDFERYMELQKEIENNADIMGKYPNIKKKFFSEDEIKATKIMDEKIVQMIEKSLKIKKINKNKEK